MTVRREVKTMRLAPDIQEFFVEGSNQDASHVLLHIAEPATPEEAERGYFFALIEVVNGYSEQIVELQKIIDDVEALYYSEDESASLEKILEDINRQGHHLLEYAGSTLHCLLGVLQGRKLSIAYHGDVRATLLFTKDDGLASLEIIEQKNEEDQLFSELAEGSIAPGDYLILATPEVHEFFSSDRIVKIVQSRTLRQAALHVQKVLTDLRNELSYGGIFLYLPKSGVNALGVQRTADEGSQKSIDKMLNTAKRTEHTLSPPMLGNLAHRYERKRKAESRRRKEDPETNYRPGARRAPREIMSERMLIGLGRALTALGNASISFFKYIGRGIGYGGVTIFYLTTNRHGRRTEIIGDWHVRMRSYKSSLARLPLMSKILFALAILLALIFVGSIAGIKVREGKQARRAEFDARVQAITARKDEAEAKLIYGEDSSAIALLQEAQTLLSGLPVKKKDDEKTAQELAQGIAALTRKLQKITIVSAEEVADISAEFPDARATGLVALGDKLVAFGPDDSRLYSIDKATHRVEARAHETVGGLARATVPKEDDKIIFSTRDGRIAEYGKETGALSARAAGFPASNPVLADIVVYNRRLYALDTANGQIYKHSQTQTGYDRGAAWVNDGGGFLREARSIAIDGDIFVGLPGKIAKLSGGTLQQFDTSGIQPPLQDPVALWTYNGVPDIFILDPPQKRVVRIDKNGRLLEQYTAEQWQNPTGMSVDELSGIVYVLDSGKIYSFKW